MPVWILVAVLVLGTAGTVGAETYDFAIAEAAPKPYEIGVRLEARYLHHRYDRDSAKYRLDALRGDPGAEAREWHGVVEPMFSYRRGMVKAALVTHHAYVDDGLQAGTSDDVYEGYVSLTPSPRFTLDLGKRSVLWGKGYAWNPAGFVNRPRDPDDATQNLEGRVVAGVDLIQSFAGGSLTNMGLTALVLPVIDDWANPEMGADGDVNWAVKLYLLWHDTDIDLIWFDGPSQPLSLGFDFSKNLAENIEVHGELGWRRDAVRTVVDARGQVRLERIDPLDWLLGMRYLNAWDTTFIVEYYHRGSGYRRDQLEDLFAFQAAAVERWRTTGEAASVSRARQVTEAYFSQRNPGRDYGYFKVFQKEPFDLLYVTSWIAMLANLQDGSFNVQPGLTWTPLTNLELNFRVAIPVGPAGTEFGEKPDAVRPEVWVRYYF
ncbi:MAG TPA: hypothetical protein ENF48_06015 [Desulfobacteraceae bacterium]|nr:hypothetical protein [Desulfobacteraceae bacterium]